MAAYCTQSDLLLAIREKELVQLSNDDNGDSIDTDNVNRAIDRASNRIDAVAGAYYVVPFDPIPDFIRDLAVDLTLVGLAERRAKAPKWAETKRERVHKDLGALAKGTLTVGDQPAPARNPERTGDASHQDRTFTAASLKGF